MHTGDSSPRMHTGLGATIIASQPVARITTSTTTKKRQSSRRTMSLPASFVQRISHGCRERAERGAVVLETHVRIAQSVDHRQYNCAVYFQHPCLDLHRGYTNSTNLAGCHLGSRGARGGPKRDGHICI